MFYGGCETVDEDLWGEVEGFRDDCNVEWFSDGSRSRRQTSRCKHQKEVVQEMSNSTVEILKELQLLFWGMKLTRWSFDAVCDR